MPSSRTVTVDLSRLSGTHGKAWWFNPRTGTAQAAGELQLTSENSSTRPEMGTGFWSSTMQTKGLFLLQAFGRGRAHTFAWLKAAKNAEKAMRNTMGAPGFSGVVPSRTLYTSKLRPFWRAGPRSRNVSGTFPSPQDLKKIQSLCTKAPPEPQLQSPPQFSTDRGLRL